ncbi:MAG: zinc ribbon domain-containing protein [Acidobacteriota bacterium]|jgi:putative FmdB family regulatory protein|nr:zinc ribbon domain-containing protein [Acidobacteriota bacterium]
MPIYEYRCTQCGRTFEVLQRINAEPLQQCIHCGGKVEKLVSASSFQLKGSGWYVTDYAHKNKGKDRSTKEKKENSDTKSSVENVNKK